MPRITGLDAAVRRTVSPAFWALSAYRGTALLVAATAATALAAVLPVTSLATRDAIEGVTTRLGLAPWRGGDLGMSWSLMGWSPTETRHAALVLLFRLLLGVAASVLAVAGLTIASLSAARAAARARELRVRRAVGASRWDLFAAGLCESGAVAGLALVLGGGLGVIVGRPANAAWTGTLGRGTPAPSLLAAAAAVAGIMVGTLLPLAFRRRTAPLPGGTGKPLQLSVPAVQLGLSLTALTAAALLGREAGRWLAPDGAPARQDLVFDVTAPAASPATRAAGYASLLRRLDAHHTLRIVSLASPGTLMGLGMVDWVTTDCGACPIGTVKVAWRSIFATHHLVSADTFRVLGLGVAAGRGITAADHWGAPRVAVVNRHLAARYFERGEAVGRRIWIGRGPGEWYSVVGVVDDQRPTGFGGGLEPPDAVYLSILQHPAPSVELLVRSLAGVDGLAALRGGLRSALGVDAAAVVPVSASRLAEREAAPLHWFGWMFAAEGWVLLAVATVGTFVVMRMWITSLLYELGVRRAAGARRGDIVRFVLWRAAGVAIAGVAIGLWIGLIVWGSLAAVVAGLPVWDVRTALRFAPLLVAATFAGALEPVWRATRAAPATLIAGWG